MCCEYSQIFYPDSQMLLCNEIASVDGNLYNNIENGELSRYYDADGNEVDIKQNYDDDDMGFDNSDLALGDDVMVESQ